jgi:hypothetical protein
MTLSLRILLPPGLGDSHWVLLKLRAFLKAKTSKAKVWSLAIRGDRKRAIEFLRRVPFVEAVDYHEVSLDSLRKELPAMINDEPRQVIPGMFGFDYYLCFNQALRDGTHIDDILPECPTDWDYPVAETDDDSRYRTRFAKVHGPYALFYFSRFGMHARWAKHFGTERARNLLMGFRKEYPSITPVLVGMGVDVPFLKEIRDLAVDLAEKTTTGQLLSLIRGAACMVGFHNGPTILSQHLGTPTLMLWSRDHFRTPAFRTDWVDPRRIGKIYISLEVEESDEGTVLDAMRRLLKN